MADLLYLHKYMVDRRKVVLVDGRTGRILRLDTAFPGRRVVASIWTDGADGPAVAKVDVEQIVGLVPLDNTG
jgi:hypothetical protein